MLAIASDHGGFSLKESIKAHLDKVGVTYRDFGTSGTESCDYPVFAKAACKAVLGGDCHLAVLVCGTGIGMSLAANKIHGIRAAVCSDYFSAKMTRAHNNANVLCLGERVVGTGLANELVDIFLSTEYEGGRHARRVDMLTDIEKENS